MFHQNQHHEFEKIILPPLLPYIYPISNLLSINPKNFNFEVTSSFLQEKVQVPMHFSL
jgi:hypothetical protein